MISASERIAIVASAIRLPGAGASLDQFWRSISTAKDCSTVVAADRWILPPERCLDPRVAQADSVYSDRGYYLDPFIPNLAGLQIDPALVAELDPLFHIVLDAGTRAWSAAKTDVTDRARVGVVLGNICLPTERSNALCREYLGGTVAKAYRTDVESKRTHPWNRYVAGLPAGLLARALSLGGGSFTLDAACASSLYAIKLAADELLAGRADAMLAGGVNGSDCQYTQMGFAQLRALSVSGRCSPFDVRADGLMVGEGAAIFVLKRLSDAMKQGDRILALIAGIGLSNDMHGNLLAPAKEGQLRAMRHAYERAGWKPQDVDLIECHATGTPVGDAIEFESLRELWGNSDWVPGQCVIGSVKSSVGHLLTGAGAAAVAKVLKAIDTETLPPQANFETPATGLNYTDGPFQVLNTAKRWSRRTPLEPRRAAVSGFGFGGVNAHLLLEEWTGVPYRVTSSSDRRGIEQPKLTTVSTRESTDLDPERKPAEEPVAIVGMAAHFGPCTDLRAFQERVLGSTVIAPKPKQNGWGLADEPPPAGFGIEEFAFPTDRFRTPPKELEETLPQQLLMLQVAANALDNQLSPAPHPAGTGDPTTAVFIGLGLDPNTTNFHLRWSMLAHAEDNEQGLVAAELVSPPLTANRTMGALGSIAASRIARAFHFGGPSHTVCSEEASAARAVELAVKALRNHEIDRALAGGVDLACDPRTVLPGKVATPGEGAAALVLKRLADAERDGDRIYAVIRGVGVANSHTEAEARAMADADLERTEAGGVIAFDATAAVGNTGAASAAASLVKACLALYQQILPGSGTPRYWLHDRATGPRRAIVSSAGADGSCLAITLEESTTTSTVARELEQPLGAREEAVFLVDAGSHAELITGVERLADFAQSRSNRGIESLAREWFRQAPPDATHPLAVGFVPRSVDDIAEQTTFAIQHLRTNPTVPLSPDGRVALRDRVFYSPRPLGRNAKVALVFPGSGNQFDGMGRDLTPHWPEILRKQQSESELLRSQFTPESFWDGTANSALPRDLMFGQVTVGALVSDIVLSLGVRCDAAIGVSLGESAGMFGVRAWRSRDEMFLRMQRSTLFNSDLAPPYNAARSYWSIPADQQIEWSAAVIGASADDVAASLRPGLKAFLLIVNTPNECVIGGERGDVEKLALAIGKPFVPLAGVTLAHCNVGQPVEVPYRELHTLPVTAPRGVVFYSGAWGRSYTVTEKSAADSITAGLLNPIDVPAVVNAAYRDGVRIFLEVGPGASCTRMIAAILGEKPHLARAAHAAKTGAISQILRLLANLAAERVRIDLSPLYGRETDCLGHREHETRRGPELVITVGNRPPVVEPPTSMNIEPPAMPSQEPTLPFLDDDWTEPDPSPADHDYRTIPDPVTATNGAHTFETLPGDGTVLSVDYVPAISPLIEAACSVQVESMRAQETFLRVNQRLMDSAAGVLRFQTALLESWMAARSVTHELPIALLPRPVEIPASEFEPEPPPAPAAFNEPESVIKTEPLSPPRSLSYEQCCAYAVGRIGDVLGPLFAHVDDYPTRVRLPDGPLQLVDRITLIEGEPNSMGRGRCITEHAVRADRWYLEAGRIPTAIAVEAGQADLFLSGFLGIDSHTRGLAVYRLLDAVVSFHRGLPRVGETVVYDIHIDEFTRQADAWLFRFRFDGTVNGEPFITMRNGVAGFFTAEALAAGKGIVQTALDRQQRPGKRPDDWQELVSQSECALDHDQVEALRCGDLAMAFGSEFAGLPLRHPLPLPGGQLRLVDRVPIIDPTGGRFGIGFVRAEFDIQPNDWFLTCHFVDDQVMPGTLMYECCLHTLRILLSRMGWVGEAGEVVCEPVPGIESRLKCRGQVIASTKTVTYEVTVKELGFRPEPYCLADALMYADGKPIVEISNMSLRMSGLTREKLEATWTAPVSPVPRKILYDSASIMEYSNGRPSTAFGEPYRIFDSERTIARLPGPPYQFLDRIVATTGEPFVLQAGAACVAEYDIPTDAWYFGKNRSETMPFSVLLEIALQPCGWLAAYCGSALTSPEDLSFRNLGGRATQYLAVTGQTGTLSIRVSMTSVSKSAGMIIQHYDMLVTSAAGKVYEGTTYFGFFSKPQLANQVGIREAKVPWPSGQDVARAERGELPHSAPFPAPMLRMVDRVEAYLPTGGEKGLGLVVGRIAVDPEFWFFKAHFFQDPVWPGSLGLESFLQLLKYAAWKRWGDAPAGGWQTVALNRPHSWTYRGQVLPTDREVTVLLEIVAIDDSKQSMTAKGFLTVDGRVIYQMTDFTLE